MTIRTQTRVPHSYFELPAHFLVLPEGLQDEPKPALQEGHPCFMPLLKKCMLLVEKLLRADKPKKDDDDDSSSSSNKKK